MSLSDWFRRTFFAAPTVEGAEDDAVLREEYGEEAPEQAAPGVGMVGGMSGFAGLETAEAAEDAEAATEPPEPGS